MILLMVFIAPSTLCVAQNTEVHQVLATQLSNSEVKVEWSWSEIVPQAVVIDFETGDFSQGNFIADEEYPWEITQDAYEGNYAAKSSNKGVDNGEHFLTLEVDVPYDAVMSFYHKVSSEWAYDGGIFYIDGQSKASMTGIDKDWEYVEVSVPAGKHTYSWGYFKDESDFDGEDTYWVDNIVPFAPREEISEGWLHYDDGYFVNAIGMGEQNIGADNYWAVSFPDMSEYAGQTLTKVAVMLYQGTNATATVCLGGTDAPGTVMATKSFTAIPGEIVDVELDTPVAIDGTQPLWIVMHNNDAAYPAASSQFCGDPNSSWFMMDNAWYDVATLGVNPMTWIIRGYVEDAEGRTAAISQGEFAPMATTADKVMAFTPEKRMIVGTPASNPRSEGYTYNLYKKNVFTGAEAELIAEGLTDTTYVDNTWATAEAGVYQWGVEVVAGGSRNVNRGDVLNVDFEDGEWPEGWLSLTELTYPSLAQWAVRSGLSATELNPIGLNAAYSEGQGYNGNHFNMITSAVDLTAETTPSLSFMYANPDWLGDYCMLNVKVGTSQEGPWETVWTTGTNCVAELTSVTVDLSAYAGQTIYINFENEDYYGYGICVDNIVVSSGGNDPVDPTVGNIVWSNTLDKDMFTTVNVAVELNTEESAKGTEVTLANVNEPEYVYETVLDATGTYTWNEIRRGTYEFTVYKKGYESSATAEVVEILDETALTCALTEIVSAANKLYVSPTGWAMWEGEKVITKGDEFSFGFEDGTINGWTTYDVDGDSYTWEHVDDFWTDGYGYNSNASILSASFINDIGALYPDNYIVTEEKYLIGDASQLTFMVSPFDDNFPYEHYGVAVSTTGNTPNDLEMIWEETFVPGKGAPRDANAVRAQNITREGNWYLRTVDLSEFSGQEIYIALRHFECTDQYIFFIDDITLTNATKSSRAIESYTVLLNGVEEATVTSLEYQHEDITPGETYTTTVIANFASGSSDPVEYTWTAVACDEFEGVSDLKAEYSNANAVLSWTLPEGAASTEEFKYDDGENWNFVGLAGYGNIKWAVMFPAEDLTAGTLTEVSMYDGVAHTGDIYIYLGGNTAPETLMTTQPYECVDIEDFSVFELNEPVAIDGTQNLWIVFGNNDMSGNIAPVSHNETTPNARWFSVDGVNWLDVSVAFAMTDFSFQIRGYIETGSYPLGVMIYRDDELLTEEIWENESYMDPLTESGTFNYCVEVVYNNYAVSCPQCVEFEYIISVDENNANAMNVYPNPVKDNLTITAEAMTRITITNTLGQVMLDENVASDSEVINMSQYEAGVYVVRITTESGVAVERISVVK